MNGPGKTRVQFHFRLHDQPTMAAVEKDEGGRKRRYLEGIASGSRVDGHGERMTPNCISSFQRQAESGEILLYEGLHGVNFVNDIGKLVKSTISPEGDWHCQFRLYDELDGMGPGTLEVADKVWKQVCGLPPYTKPRQKGFSIEGEVPDGGILSADTDGRRVMNDVTLEGVVLVNKPAYRDSIAHAVYKALGVPAPWQVRRSLEKSFSDISTGQPGAEPSFFGQWYRLQDALDDRIRDIMTGDDVERRPRLQDLFSQFAEFGIDQILAHPEAFTPSGPEGSDAGAYPATSARLVQLRALEQELRALVQSKRAGGRNEAQ